MSPRCQAASATKAKPLAWTMLSGSETTDTWAPTGMIDPSLIRQGGMWDFRFLPKGNGTFAVSLGLDKTNFTPFRDDHTFVGMADSFDQNNTLPIPTLADNLYVDARIAIKSKSGGGVSRVMIGVVARESYIHDRVMEVIVWRDPGYDGCTQVNIWGHYNVTPCDPTGHLRQVLLLGRHAGHRRRWRGYVLHIQHS